MKKVIIGILFSVGGLYFAFRQMDFGSLMTVLRSVDWILILIAVIVMIVSVWVRALRWHIILSPIKDVKTHPLFAAAMIGYFGNSVLPLRLGEFLRAYALNRNEHSVTFSTAFGTIVIERVVDMLGIMFLILALFSSYDIPQWLANSGLTLSAVVIIVSAALFWISASHHDWVEKMENIAVLQRGVGIRMKKMFHSFIEGLVTLRKIRRPVSLVFYSVSLWLMYWGITWLCARSLGIDLSWLQLGILLVSVTMVITLPSAPGFIGTYHAGAVLMLVEVFAVAQAPAQAYAIINHAVGFVPLVVIGAYYFLKSSLKLSDVKSEEAPRIHDSEKMGAIFLDRDGTLNPDPGYISSPDDYELHPETIDALKTLSATGLPFILITNQSGIGRGLIEETALKAIHNKLDSLLEKHELFLIDKYYCPHTPEDRCDCRKPATGMLTKAADDHGIDLTSSYMIGDSVADVAVANAVGVQSILVKTGNGQRTEREILNGKLSADFVGDNLNDCAKHIVDLEEAQR